MPLCNPSHRRGLEWFLDVLTQSLSCILIFPLEMQIYKELMKITWGKGELDWGPIFNRRTYTFGTARTTQHLVLRAGSALPKLFSKEPESWMCCCDYYYNYYYYYYYNYYYNYHNDYYDYYCNYYYYNYHYNHYYNYYNCYYYYNYYYYNQYYYNYYYN
ncbi:hypothetical protein P7K49_025858 [Saguinus oedipus]|uniref:Uncharacterized protein n=1 Tax=Saguinus oedipus TaxID=9490 RepID=A0ABQ9UID8_SAGOE|nr:hypothetical protein P7K49_025858 [Saguinus oedipus]